MQRAGGTGDGGQSLFARFKPRLIDVETQMVNMRECVAANMYMCHAVRCLSCAPQELTTRLPAR